MSICNARRRKSPDGYLHIDYEDKPVTLEVDVKGPFLGIGWEF
jgi:hypothetical protein